MKKAFFALLFVFVLFISKAQTLSPSSKISLLTASPGTDLYSTFGHNAIRIVDPENKLDLVFNYGTFEFDPPYFYVKFVRGQLEYKLSVQRFKDFKYSYVVENRSVDEQLLNLSLTQRQKLFGLLLENHKLENRYYKYDFFYDNCATRIRDLMPDAFDEFSYHYPQEWERSGLSFRNLIDLYLTTLHWSDFGIDIALGLPTDAIARPTDFMFLPDYLEEGFQTATIVRDGQEQPFVISKQTIVPRLEIEPDVFFITPGRLMWSIFIAACLLTFLSYKNGFSMRWFDILYFSIIGIIGWVVFFLWFFTDHVATKDNLNLLWAVPFHLPIFIFWSKLSWKFKKFYIWISGGLLLIILISWPVFPQYYHFAFIPMILIMVLRFIVMLKVRRAKPIH